MKTIILILILMVSSVVHSEYITKFPLEQSNSGPLPNGSIQFKSAVIPETTDPLDCRFEEGSNSYYWLRYSDSGIVQNTLFWEGSQINAMSTGETTWDTPVTLPDGFIYSPGPFARNEPNEFPPEWGVSTNYYTICREAEN